MSMKYYAVTDDPNELLHYGVKGMKWGQHIFGDKPKSAGYHRARAKLNKIRSDAKKAASFAKSAIKASKQQIAVNHQKKREEKYNRAVMKAQQRVNAIEGLNTLNQMQNYAKRAQTQALASNNASKLSLRQEKRYAKNEAKMDKYLQQARQGKLKYGKLSEDQVARIQDRLGLEANTRRLGSAEKTWHQQKKEARRAGKLRGIEAGTAAAMTEIAKAGAQFGVAHVIDRWKLNSASKHEGERQHIKTRAQNKKSRSEMREDLQNEAYETQIREGDSYDWFTARAGEKLKKIEDKKHEQQRIQAIQDRMHNEMDLSNEGQYKNKLLSRKEQKQIQGLRDQYQNFITDKREADRIQKVQDRLDDKRDEDFYNKFIGEKGYKSEDEAIKAHGSKLLKDATDAKFTYGDGSQQFRDALDTLNNFNNASTKERKTMMNAYASKEEKQNKDTNTVNAMAKAALIQQINAKNAMIRSKNNAKVAAYEQALKNWQNKPASSRGAKPQLGKLTDEDPMPTFTVKELESLFEIGVNPYQSNGGGGKKKNK